MFMITLAKNIFKQDVPGHRLVTTRVDWVDHARGFAILFVVYRHVIIGMKKSGMFVSEYIYNFQEIIYNFRMPLFFVLSGMFIVKSLKSKSSLTVIKDK